MDLPDFERVIYEKNPLIEVVCQLRFPPILKIGSQEPADFQDRVRVEYPLFESSEQQIPVEITKLVGQFGLPFKSETAYSFKSADQKWNITLAKDSIALTTNSYERYEKFKERLQKVLEVFEELYKPSFYTRIGFRYRDLIVRSKLGIEDVGWSELIESHIASELYDPVLSSSLQYIMKNMSLKLEAGMVNLSHGLVVVKDSGDNKDGEDAYLFDSDFYLEQSIGDQQQHDVFCSLDKFNRSAGKIFRWGITEKLHESMCPRSTG